MPASKRNSSACAGRHDDGAVASYAAARTKQEPQGAGSRMRAPSPIAVMVMLPLFVDAREARGGVWIAAHEPRDLGSRDLGEGLIMVGCRRAERCERENAMR
jgi:hypothetical protein